MSADRKSLHSFSPCHVPGLSQSRVGGTLGGQLYGLGNGGEGVRESPARSHGKEMIELEKSLWAHALAGGSAAGSW